MTIFERIRERREKLEMTQEELAKLTGYTSRSMIGKIENGQRDINQSQIVIFDIKISLDIVNNITCQGFNLSLTMLNC